MPPATLKRPTVADVAREAGVSTGTVSAVLNRKPTVADATRDLVLGVVNRIGYRPPPSPRAFSNGAARGATVDAQPRTAGVVIKEGDNPYYADVVAGVREALGAHGVLTTTGTSDGDYKTEGDLIDAYRAYHAAGVIVAPVLDLAVDLSHLFSLRREGYPFVVLGDVHGLRAPSVTVDNVAASEAAVRHLLDGGHERVVHVAGPVYSQHSRDRRQGVERAFSRSALRFHDGVFVEGGARLEDGYRAALALFRDAAPDARPTGVTCFNDLVAMGVLRALAELGLDVPGDVSVVGFDDLQSSAYLSVPLTTVRVPKREMGRHAADLLLRQIDDAGSARPAPPRPAERVSLDAPLVVRASTRPL